MKSLKDMQGIADIKIHGDINEHVLPIISSESIQPENNFTKWLATKIIKIYNIINRLILKSQS